MSSPIYPLTLLALFLFAFMLGHIHRQRDRYFREKRQYQSVGGLVKPVLTYDLIPLLAGALALVWLAWRAYYWYHGLGFFG